MNERIKLLEKQAFDEVWDLDNDPIGPGTQFVPLGFKEKFAELIVQECIGVVQKGGGMCGAISSNNLKQHFFGVEE